MESQSTRRYEMALPLFSGLDLSLLLEAQAQIKSQDVKGLTKLITTLGPAGTSKTVRKLVAIYRATDLELKKAEADPEMRKEMEERVSEVPFKEAFTDAMTFLTALFESLGLTLGSSEGEGAATETAKGKKGKGPKRPNPTSSGS
ncbi:hypothetical protein [Mesoterricola silvestris]|uniref:Uncharacterized protein n=1 Tax=Mesoterricola silvestris TaxID=2927979 RepID=A0AA48KBW5_9BACT|nr:hypothetical protein [Mesoterricola silvestris]BDU72908.1 hypothetical protein METEAL_20820 [Mesoterricola silvestris]